MLKFVPCNYLDLIFAIARAPTSSHHQAEPQPKATKSKHDSDITSNSATVQLQLR